MALSAKFYAGRWNQMNIPMKHQGMRLDTYEPVHHSGKIASLEARDFVDTFTNRYISVDRAKMGDLPDDRRNIGKGLMLYGRNGTRKSTLAMMILTEVQYLHPEYRGYYIRFSDWQTAITDTFVSTPTARSERAQTILNIVDRVPLLVLDDVGQEYRKRDSDFVNKRFHELLRSRYDKAQPTIITTNLDPDSLREAYDTSLDSFRHDAFDAFEMLGADSRKPKRS